ncbi:MAG: right-handed parallel beta-helix repeat-containing protein [Thermoplasmata archaeon]
MNKKVVEVVAVVAILPIVAGMSVVLFFPMEQWKKAFATPISYTSHTPIHINGNTEFTGANGVTGDSGTQKDPYIIEGWKWRHIHNASGNQYGIHQVSSSNNITYNWIWNNANYGVYITSGSTENTIHHNQRRQLLEELG